MIEISLEEAAGKLAMLLEKAREGADVVLTENGQHVGSLVPAERVTPRPPGFRQPGTAADWKTIVDDFNEPLEDFADYM